MTIGIVARKLLWSRAGDQCAWPGCEECLTVDLHDVVSAKIQIQGIIMGEEAHIRSGRPDGPRYDASYPGDRVDLYENLILLCPNHHTLIDKEGGVAASVEQLLAIKRQHEERLALRRGVADRTRQVLEERTTASVAAWESTLQLDDWRNLTFGLNSPIPRITSGRFKRLVDTGELLLAKDWPREFPRLRKSFTRLRRVIGVLIEHLNESMDATGGRYETRREYKTIGWDPKRYKELLNDFRLDAATTRWLAQEMTRCVNLVISAIRHDLDPLYRFDEGIVLMQEGDGIFVNRAVRVEFEDLDWEAIPPVPDLGTIRQALLLEAGRLGGDPEDVDVNRLLQ